MANEKAQLLADFTKELLSELDALKQRNMDCGYNLDIKSANQFIEMRLSQFGNTIIDTYNQYLIKCK